MDLAGLVSTPLLGTGITLERAAALASGDAAAQNEAERTVVNALRAGWDAAAISLASDSERRSA